MTAILTAPLEVISTRTATVEVTSADIENGICRDPGLCPIGLALTRLTGREWFVGPEAASIVASPARVRLPLRARMFVKDFDRGLPVAPFSFELPL